MTVETEDIIHIEGHRDLLLVAPHGHRKDDENTAELTTMAASRLGCRAIVNFGFRKPRGAEKPDPAARLLNLNKSDQAAAHPWFLDAIRSAIDTPQRTLVIWVHGIKDENIEAEGARTGACDGEPGKLLVLAGYGQGGSPKTGAAARHTARPETAERLVKSLTANGLPAVAARDDAPTYRGRHEDYMNQWFLENGYPLAAVESIQLELKFTGVRDRASLKPASKRLANALRELIWNTDRCPSRRRPPFRPAEPDP